MQGPTKGPVVVIGGGGVNNNIFLNEFKMLRVATWQDNMAPSL